MSDQERKDLDRQLELRKLEQTLKSEGLSRRNFLDRMKLLGVGFGAAYILGVKEADALGAPEGGVAVSSSNPAVDEILAEAQESHADAGEVDDVSAQYGRFYRRGYRRGYRRYGRVYRRGYRRGYRRYGRIYRRGYRRYGRWYRRYARFYARF